MNRLDHAAEAERLLARAAELHSPSDQDIRTAYIGMAQAHATLAGILEPVDFGVVEVQGEAIDIAQVAVGSRVLLVDTDPRRPGRLYIDNTVLGTVESLVSPQLGALAAAVVRWDDTLSAPHAIEEDDDAGTSTHHVAALRVVLGV